MKITTSILASVLALTPMTSAWACASCGCSLNSDWSAQGLASSGGWSADVRVDYLDQNQLRQGTGTISGGNAFTITPDALKGGWLGEARVLTGGFDYTMQFAATAQQTLGKTDLGFHASLSMAF